MMEKAMRNFSSVFSEGLKIAAMHFRYLTFLVLLITPQCWCSGHMPDFAREEASAVGGPVPTTPAMQTGYAETPHS